MNKKTENAWFQYSSLNLPLLFSLPLLISEILASKQNPNTAVQVCFKKRSRNYFIRKLTLKKIINGFFSKKKFFVDQIMKEKRDYSSLPLPSLLHPICELYYYDAFLGNYITKKEQYFSFKIKISYFISVLCYINIKDSYYH